MSFREAPLPLGLLFELPLLIFEITFDLGSLADGCTADAPFFDDLGFEDVCSSPSLLSSPSESLMRFLPSLLLRFFSSSLIYWLPRAFLTILSVASLSIRILAVSV